MNAQRLAEIERGQTAIAKKVLGVVPIAEPWTGTQIAAELHRATQSRLEPNVLMGSLRTLVDAGLVKEVGGTFRRITAKPKPPAVAPALAPAVEVAQQQEAAPPVDRISAAAVELRAMATVLESPKLLQLAAAIEDAALDFEVSVEGMQDELQKLRQLQAILKSLG